LRSTWPLDGERNGGSKKIRGVHQMLSAEMSQARRTKNHWPHQTTTDKNRKVAHPLVVRRAREKTVAVHQHFASVIPEAALPGHKSSYMQSRLIVESFDGPVH
jgi:hypothetical protein